MSKTKQFNFSFKLDQHLGTIYIKPVMQVSGSFNPEEELEQFISQLSEDIRKKTIKYLGEE